MDETIMQYSELLVILQKATSEELAQDITVYTELNEFVPVSGVQVSGEQKDCPADGILDKGHLYLEIDG